MTLPAHRLVDRYGPEAVIAAMRPLLSDERIARIEAVLDARLDSVTVAIENLHDPHNGAAAIRSIEAIGVTTLHVAETVEKFHFSPAVTIGCEKWLDISRYPSFESCATTLKNLGFQLYAACPDGDFDLESVDVTGPVAIAFGNEHAGLTDAAIAACGRRLSIPMYGFTQSFNLSVSIAITMYRIAARRRAAVGASGDLDRRKRALLRARWYAHGVRGAEAIMERYVSETTQARVSGESSES